VTYPNELHHLLKGHRSSVAAVIKLLANALDAEHLHTREKLTACQGIIDGAKLSRQMTLLLGLLKRERRRI
jgi:hypothetical protein